MKSCNFPPKSMKFKQIQSCIDDNWYDWFMTLIYQLLSIVINHNLSQLLSVSCLLCIWNLFFVSNLFWSLLLYALINPEKCKTKEQKPTEVCEKEAEKKFVLNCTLKEDCIFMKIKNPSIKTTFLSMRGLKMTENDKLKLRSAYNCNAKCGGHQFSLTGGRVQYSSSRTGDSCEWVFTTSKEKEISLKFTVNPISSCFIFEFQKLSLEIGFYWRLFYKLYGIGK